MWCAMISSGLRLNSDCRLRRRSHVRASIVLKRPVLVRVPGALIQTAMQACGADGFRRHASPAERASARRRFSCRSNAPGTATSVSIPTRRITSFSARIRAISRLSCARRTPRERSSTAWPSRAASRACASPEVLEFLRCAKELYPDVHVRIYTSGDLLDDAFLAELASAGLDELRFSVKPQETDGAQEALFERMAAAVRVIPDVMVEMPVMPGEEEEMRALLVRLDSLGVRGINLLELCSFRCITSASSGAAASSCAASLTRCCTTTGMRAVCPLPAARSRASICCASPKRRGFRWACITARWTAQNTGQVFQQNRGFLLDDGFAHSHAWLAMDSADYFLKCAKAFGKDASSVRESRLASEEGMEAVEVALKADVEAPLSRSVCRAALRGGHFDHVAYGRVARVDEQTAQLMGAREDSLRGLPGGIALRSSPRFRPFIPLPWASAVQARFPEVELAQCWHVVEFDESTGPVLREVHAASFV